MGNLALDVLEQKRQQLIDEKRKCIEKFDNDIAEVVKAMEAVLGHPISEIHSTALLYDDENPDYIRQSQEEI